MADSMFNFGKYRVVSACRSASTVFTLSPCLDSNAANIVAQVRVKE